MTVAVAAFNAPVSAQIQVADPSDLDLLGRDVDVDRIVLDVVKKGVPGFEARGSIIDASVKDSTTQAPTFTLTLHDPQLRLLRSDVIWTTTIHGSRVVRPVDVEVRGRPYRLVQIQWGAASAGSGVDIVLTFEHRLVAYLREHDRPRKVSRNKSTLAEFISTFAREVKAVDIRFLCKELHKKQPIEKATQDVSQKSRDANHDPGLPTNADVTVKHRPATKRQRQVIDAVLRTGDSKNVPDKALVIAVMVVTQESIAGLKPGTGSLVGNFWQDSSYGTPDQRRDTHHAASKFYDKLMKVIKAHPSGMSYGELADKVQIAGTPGAYQQWKDEAEHTVKQFGGSSGGGSRTFIHSFNYTRGVDGKREDSWSCSQRYASLVNWRSFVKGKATWVYESEPVLFAARPLYRIHRGDAAVADITGDCDTGKRVQTLTCMVRVALWSVPVGSTVIVDGEGPATDRWLIEDYERSLYDALGTLTVARPTPPKAEPAPDTGSSSTDATTKGKAGRLYKECKHIGAIGGPYDWGGGHGPALSSIDASYIKGHGLDCSGSVSLALWRADLFKGDTAITSGDFSGWGRPGKGSDFTVWYNGDHVWIEFHGLGTGKRFDTSPHGDGANGPRVRNSARSASGFTPRHWPGL